MGIFDSWLSESRAEFLSVIEYVNQLAASSNSTIKATISYLLNHNCLDGDLYINKDYTLTKIDKVGWLDIETPNDALEALYLAMEAPFYEMARSIDTLGNDTVSSKFKDYYLSKKDLPAITFDEQSKPVIFKPIKFDRAEAEKFAPIPLVNNQQTGKASEAQPLELSDNQKILQLMEMYNVHELACFITDLNPVINDNLYYDDLDYDSYCAVINKAIKAGKLVADGSGEIMKDEAKRWLKSIGKVYQGFNDQNEATPAIGGINDFIPLALPLDFDEKRYKAETEAYLEAVKDIPSDWPPVDLQNDWLETRL